MQLNLPEHIDPRHPILKQEYAIYTSAIDEMITTLGKWIDEQRSGGYIFGPSRFGKSHCLRYFVRKELEAHFSAFIPLVIWSMSWDIQNSGAEFWKQLLLATHFHFIDPHKTKRKRDLRFLLVEQLITLARSADENYVVLLIDEAQLLGLNEWYLIAGLQNSLEEQSVHLSVFSIGSHQLGYQPKLAAAIGDGYIAARYLAVSRCFHGICSDEDLGFVLQGYDEESDWPKGTHTSYLKYFAPELYQNGKRLKSCSSNLWNAMNKLSPKPGRGTRQEYPMQHVARVVEKTLKQLCRGDNWNELTSQQGWESRLEGSGFCEHMRIVMNQY